MSLLFLAREGDPLVNDKIPQFQIPGWLAAHITEVRSWPSVQGADRTCDVTACKRSAYTLGLCHQHRHRFRGRAQRAEVPLADWLVDHRAEVAAAAPVGASDSACWVTACHRSGVANGLCKAHGAQARRRFYEKPSVGPASDEETHPEEG